MRMRKYRLLLAAQKLRNLGRALRLTAVAFGDARRRGVCAEQEPDRVITCRFCGATAAHEVIGKPPITFAGPITNPGYSLIRCTGCDVVYLDPIPPQEDLKILYEETGQFSELSDPHGAPALRIHNSYGRRLRYLGLLPDAGESILEIGAGPAWVSRACKEYNASVRTVAQDVSAECSATSPWVDEYLVGPLELVPRREFQLVSMTHVIEHLPNPERMLSQLREYVGPGGHVYINAPHRPPMWRPGAGIDGWLRYSYLHVPAHISYLSRKWLAQCAVRSGFKLVHWDESLDAYQAFEAVLRR